MTDDSHDIPAGWYPDSEGTIRWWDGAEWTENVQRGSGDPEATVVMPADRSDPAERRRDARPTDDDDEPDHKRRTWLVATVVGLLALFLGMGIAGGGSSVPEVPIAGETATSGATEEELNQREDELEQREGALRSQESELKQREQDVEAREENLEEAEASTGADTIGSGVYQVGTDVQPGQYVTGGPEDPEDTPCSFRVSSDEAGEDVITSEESEGQAEVFLEEGQYFMSESCLIWELQ